jgi:hypothetical protein
MRVASMLLVMQLAASSCRSGDESQAGGSHLPPSAAADGSAPAAPAHDSDGDGLCDASEQQLGTNPQVADTDGDGYPDELEVISGYDPNDPTSPGLDQIAYLQASAGASLDFEVQPAVQGDGAGVTGQFVDHNAYDPHGLRAGAFFVNAVAVSADPPDNVRGMAASEERFGSVLGKTLLTFRLHFEYPMINRQTCVAALPFDYSIKSDSGGVIGGRSYLLVVTTSGTPIDQSGYCRPVACL